MFTNVHFMVLVFVQLIYKINFIFGRLMNFHLKYKSIGILYFRRFRYKHTICLYIVLSQSHLLTYSGIFFIYLFLYVHIDLYDTIYYHFYLISSLYDVSHFIYIIYIYVFILFNDVTVKLCTKFELTKLDVYTQLILFCY